MLPLQAFAHGEAAEAQTNGTVSMSLFIGVSLLFILFFGLYLLMKSKAKNLHNAKKQEDRQKRLQFSKAQRLYRWGWIASLVGALITGSTYLLSSGQTEIVMDDIHGLSYSKDGKSILVPAHDGIPFYADGHWAMLEGERNDYMGFSAVDDGFYSSGHPPQGSDKKNPLGIVKSTDEGKTLQFLDLYGQADFHVMAAGFQSHAIYVINMQPNSRMDAPGLYVTTDEAKTWKKGEMKGITEEPLVLAAHPTNEAIVAIGTATGVYLSKDYGNSFEKIMSNGQATSLSFNNQGVLFIGGYTQSAYLQKYDIDTKKTEDIKIPVLQEDAVAFLAQNPLDENSLVFATYKKDVYLSTTKGAQWTQIAQAGKGISQKAE